MSNFEQISANNVTTETANIGAFTIDTLDTTTFNANSIEAEHAICGTVSAGSLNIPSITVGNITVVQSLSNTVTSDNITGTSITSDSDTIDTLNVSDTITTTEQSTINQQLTTDTFSVTNIPEQTPYSAPNEGVFRGICFFQNVDVGIGSVGSTKISLNMKCDGNVPRIRSYNTFTGAIDANASSVFTLCTNTSPARILRFGPSDSLQIYSDNTLIWQNGVNVSDRRLKSNIINMSPAEAMEKILKINGVLYNHQFEEEETSGVILEEIRDIYPECIVSDTLVHLELLVPLLIEGMKELVFRNERVKKLRAQGALK